jgi:hypothetical protein
MSPREPRRKFEYRGPRRRVVHHELDGDKVSAVTLECGHRQVYRRLQERHDIVNCPECKRNGDPRSVGGASRDLAVDNLQAALQRSEQDSRDLRAELNVARGARPPAEVTPARREQIRILLALADELRVLRDWGPLVGALRRKYRASTAPERMAADEDLERAVRAAGILDG